MVRLATDLVWERGRVFAISLFLSRSECGATMTHTHVPAINLPPMFCVFLLVAPQSFRLVLKSLKRVHFADLSLLIVDYTGTLADQ